jgi:hypothetical protein
MPFPLMLTSAISVSITLLLFWMEKTSNAIANAIRELGNEIEKIAEALNVPLKDFFDFMHLESPVARTDNIEKLMKGMNEDYQRIIYKIVRAFEG